MSDQHMLSDRDRREIQSLVLYGTTCPLLRYHFFQISDAVGGRRFVRSLADAESPLQVTTAGLRDTNAPSQTLVYAGFTWRGLQALAVSAVSLSSFPSEFQQGAKGRATQLGDAGESAADRWLFDADAAHVAVVVYAREQHSLDSLSRQLLDLASAHACGLISMLDGQTLKDFTHPSGQEVAGPMHFGYSSGISEPEFLPALDRRPGTPAPVPPGMFILGHPQTSTGQQSGATAPLPIPATLAHNGTYGAFRMLEQDVDGYEEYLDSLASDQHARERLAARMCGRWWNGVPLSLSPDGPTATDLDSADYNRFAYGPSEEMPDAPSDADGSRCPLNAHIRQMNPRGSDSSAVRLIRRGMPYGPPYDPSHRRDGNPRGLLGLFLCASLKDQFESVMSRWIASRANNGSEPASLSRFVRTRASAYLFFPSLTGLRIISSLNEQTTSESDRRATDEAVDVVVQSMMRAIGHGFARDAHPKHHGLVKATVVIESDLPESLRHGLFASPGSSYQAYIRYSNGRPATPPPPDAAPDVRGMAIKLFGVEGDKEAADEKLTHDFILASYPAFFVPDVLGYVDFVRLTTLEDKLRSFCELPKSFRSFENPLTIRYFSQTPYSLGPLTVKYMVHPLDPSEQRPVTLTKEQMAARGPDYLREAMARHLATHPATLALCVQLPPDAAAEQVDDATRLWETPPIRVATITVPAQEFERTVNDTLAENISFSPWHCLHDHRPLGSVNLTRRRVYREASLLRHANHSVPVRELDGHELD